jgi:hypothetical protein
MADHNFIRLRAFILSHSVSQDWSTARLEWTLDAVEDLEHERDECPCGYEPIRYLCWLLNKRNNARVHVGNVCVNRFMPEHDVNTVTAGLRRIQADSDKAPNSALLIWARNIGVITEWEFNFGMDTSRRRVLSDRQWEKRREINRRIKKRLIETRRGAVLAQQSRSAGPETMK